MTYAMLDVARFFILLSIYCLCGGFSIADEFNDVRTGFTAFLDHEEDYDLGDTVIFNNVLYNFNNGYDGTTGIFTAPSAGQYLFSFQIEHWDTEKLTVDLMVDNKIQVSALIVPEQVSTQSGNTVVLGLTEGQDVWIQTKMNGTLFGSDVFHGTSFSGTFLY